MLSGNASPVTLPLLPVSPLAPPRARRKQQQRRRLATLHNAVHAANSSNQDEKVSRLRLPPLRSRTGASETSYEQLLASGKAESARHQGIYKKSQTLREALRRAGEAHTAEDAANSIKELGTLIPQARAVAEAAQKGAGDLDDMAMYSNLEADVFRLRKFAQHATADELLTVFRKARQGGYFSNVHAVDAVQDVIRGFDAVSDSGIQPDAPDAELNAALTNAELWLQRLAETGDPALATALPVSVTALGKVQRELSKECLAACAVAAEWEVAVKKLEEELAASQKVVDTPNMESGALEVAVTGVADALLAAVAKGIKGEVLWYDQLGDMSRIWLSRLQQEGNLSALALGLDRHRSWNMEHRVPDYAKFKDLLAEWQAITSRVELAMRTAETVKAAVKCSAQEAGEAVAALRAGLCDAEAQGLQVETAWIVALSSALEVWLRALLRSGDVTALEKGLTAANKDMGYFGAEASAANEEAGSALSAWRAADSAVTAAHWLATRSNASAAKLDTVVQDLRESLVASDATGLRRRSNWDSRVAEVLNGWIVRLMQEGVTAALVTGHAKVSAVAAAAGVPLPSAFATAEKRIELWRQHETDIQSALDNVVHELGEGSAHAALRRSWTNLDDSLQTAEAEVSNKLSVLSAALRDGEAVGLRLQLGWKVVLVDALDAWLDGLLQKGEIKGLQLGMTVAEGQAATLGLEVKLQEKIKQKLDSWIEAQAALQQLHEKSLHRIASKAPSSEIEDLVEQICTTQREAIRDGLCLRPEWREVYSKVLSAWLSQLVRDGCADSLANGEQRVNSLVEEFEIEALPVQDDVKETLQKWREHEAAMAKAAQVADAKDQSIDFLRDAVLNLRQALLDAEAAGLQLGPSTKAPLVSLVEVWLPAVVKSGEIEALKRSLSIVEAIHEELGLEASQDYPKLRDMLAKWQEAERAMRKASGFATQTTSMGSSPACALEACAVGMQTTIHDAKALGVKVVPECWPVLGKTLDAWLGRLVQDGDVAALESGLQVVRAWREDLGEDVEFDEHGMASKLANLCGLEDVIQKTMAKAQAILTEQTNDVAVLQATAGDVCACLRDAEEQGLHLKSVWTETAVKLLESWATALVKSGDMSILGEGLGVAAGLAAELGHERLPKLLDAEETLDQWRDAAEEIEEAGAHRKPSKSPTKQGTIDGLSRSMSSRRLLVRGDGEHARAVGRMRKSLRLAEHVGLSLKPEWTTNLTGLLDDWIAAASRQGDVSVLSAVLKEIAETIAELSLQEPNSYTAAQTKLVTWTKCEATVLTAWEVAQGSCTSVSMTGSHGEGGFSAARIKTSAEELWAALCAAKQDGLALKPEWQSTLSNVSNSWLQCLMADEVGDALENGLQTIDAWLTELGFPEPAQREDALKLLTQARGAERMARQADKSCRQALAHEAAAETLECAVADMRSALLTIKASKSVVQAEWIAVLTQVLNAWLVHLVRDGDAAELERGVDTAQNLQQELQLPKPAEQETAQLTIEKWREVERSMETAKEFAESLREGAGLEDTNSKEFESAASKLRKELRNAKTLGLRPGMEWQSALTSALDAWLQSTVKERDATVVESTVQAVAEVASEEDVPPPASLGDVKLRLLQWSCATKAVHVAKQRAVQAITSDPATSLLEEAVDLTHKALRELHTAELPLQFDVLHEWLQLEIKHLERKHDDLTLAAVTSRLDGFARLLTTGLKVEAPESFCTTCQNNIGNCASQLDQSVEICDVVADIGRIVKILVPISELLRELSPSCHKIVLRPLEKAKARRTLLNSLGEEIRAAMGDVKLLRGLLLKAERLSVKSLPELRLAQHEVTLQEFEIVDARGGQSGKVQISLMWTNGAAKTDYDILLFHPQGRTFYEEKKNKGSLYELDIDDPGREEGVESCENIFWPADSSQEPPVGWHEVKVLHYEGPLVDLRVALKLGAKRTILTFPAEAVPKKEEGQANPDLLLACKFFMNAGTNAEVHHPEGVHLTSGDDLLKQLQIWLADTRLTESPKTLRLLIDKTQQLLDKLRQGPLDTEVATNCEQSIRTASNLHSHLMALSARLKKSDADLESLTSAVQEAEKYGALEWPEAESARVALESREGLANLIQDFTRAGVEQSAEKFARRAQRVAADAMATKSAQADIVARLKEMRNILRLVEEKMEAAEAATFGDAHVQDAECHCREILAARHLRTVLLRSLLAGEACGLDEAALSEVIAKASIVGVEGDDVAFAIARLRRISTTAADSPEISTIIKKLDVS